ncbi:hypothetical protein B0J14DRAFT_659367 [Halenospora varia]|nr:hypothetical protein B0J14DRAFT_659367 [Halenospora varia]
MDFKANVNSYEFAVHAPRDASVMPPGALVLYNAAVAAAAPNQNPVLLVAGQQMAGFCHNNLQQAILALPGSNVVFVQDAITPKQVGTHRPLYINTILIQQASVLVPQGYSECQRRGFTPFPECRFVAGHFRDACGNYKWRDYIACCFAVDKSDGSDGGGDSDGLYKSEALPPPPA